MTKSEKEYAAALEPGPGTAQHVRALDRAERLAAEAREADRVDRLMRRVARRGRGSGPHTGL